MLVVRVRCARVVSQSLGLVRRVRRVDPSIPKPKAEDEPRRDFQTQVTALWLAVFVYLEQLTGSHCAW